MGHRRGATARPLLSDSANQLQDRGVDLVVPDQGIDTSTAVGRMSFQILGSIAEFEHALIFERTMDGLAAARARGRTGGQKPKLGVLVIAAGKELDDLLQVQLEPSVTGFPRLHWCGPTVAPDALLVAGTVRGGA
ncbi:recombinase family protein [Pseudonocardia sp.]|uniref:recombinase family protein n=1 Tax=Pseudonocardia sp. TaxID=60912 RepID=UPI00260F66B0|nr:recombinase family protein [Pseudonocardia sp.]